MIITYDASADAAYIQLANEIGVNGVAWTYPCDPIEIRGMVNLDFDAEDRLVGVEVLAASRRLRPESIGTRPQPGSRPLGSVDGRASDAIAERRPCDSDQDSAGMPTPEDPARAPVWENYMVAQVAEASLGLIPHNALALGVEVHGYDVTLRCQLRAVTDQDEEDLDEIASELEILVGNKVRIGVSYEVRLERQTAPCDGIRWTYIARD